ncbi:hypothetical protein BLM37_04400 [Candidatus Gracilibacteria bacterium GN02-873]|nr:hypothetical protein BLM37_04400 [Candidatus Gracilibacteria bacterium GN02-873]
MPNFDKEYPIRMLRYSKIYKYPYTVSGHKMLEHMHFWKPMNYFFQELYNKNFFELKPKKSFIQKCKNISVRKFLIAKRTHFAERNILINIAQMKIRPKKKYKNQTAFGNLFFNKNFLGEK